MGIGRVAVWLLAVVALQGFPGAALAAGPAAGFDVTVVKVSPGGGGVGRSARARRIDALLGAKLKYGSLRVLRSEHRRVELNEIASFELPTGKRFRFRPIDLGSHGALVAVDMDQTAQGDFRIPKGKPLVLGGHPYGDGQLVVVLELTE